MRQQWQIDQGKACPCKGSDDMCPCQNFNRSEKGTEMKTMTLNLSDAEMAALEELSLTHEMSKTGIVKQALRLYQLVNRRMVNGETMHFSGDRERALQFIGPGFPMDGQQADGSEGS